MSFLSVLLWIWLGPSPFSVSPLLSFSSVTMVKRLKFADLKGGIKAGKFDCAEFVVQTVFSVVNYLVCDGKDHAVLNIEVNPEQGQTYVILSRIQSLSQLHLLNMNEKKIITDKKALWECQSMSVKHALHSITAWTIRTSEYLKVSHLNIRSLPKHVTDLKKDHIQLHSDFICISELHIMPTRQRRCHLCMKKSSFTNSYNPKSHRTVPVTYLAVQQFQYNCNLQTGRYLMYRSNNTGLTQ